MRGSIETRIENAMQLYRVLDRAETDLTKEIENKQNYMLRIQEKLYDLYPDHYEDTGGWLDMEHDNIRFLEGILHDIHGFKYHRHRESKWLQSVVDTRIARLYKQVNHCNNLAKEKQVLKDIKQAEEEKRKLNVNVAEAMEKLNLSQCLTEHSSSVENIQDSIDKSYARIDEVKLEDRIERNKRRKLRKKLELLNKDISRLVMKLEDSSKKKYATRKLVVDLQKQRDEAVVNTTKKSMP